MFVGYFRVKTKKGRRNLLNFLCFSSIECVCSLCDLMKSCIDIRILEGDGKGQIQNDMNYGKMEEGNENGHRR